MHRILVEEKRWIGEARFLHALNYCMLLPGPEAQQLATYVGWLLHRTRGGLVAGTLFVLPGFVVIVALSTIYAAVPGHAGLVETLFFGLKAAVLAVVIEAVLRIGRRALKNRAMVALAALAFVAIFVLGVPFPLIVLGAGLIGLHRRPAAAGPVRGRRRTAPAGRRSPPTPRSDEQLRAHARPSLGRAVRVVLRLGRAVGGPAAAARGDLRPGQTSSARWPCSSRRWRSSPSAAPTRCWPMSPSRPCETYGWLQPGEMLDGLGMAETTPGPLILVADSSSASWPPSATPAASTRCWPASLGAVLTTWVTFVPCFLWIFLGAPYIETLRGNRALGGALSAITAAVVGVILNLAVWFALHAPVRRGARGGCSGRCARPAGPDQPRPLGGAARRRRHGGDVPLPGRHAADARRLRRGGRAIRAVF